ncbi:MAG: hypothetical protein KGJ25_06420, partial [Betaproteobacteria bacterium]|nr:hypothetical protein [Betaproteobacteria bacterium]
MAMMMTNDATIVPGGAVAWTLPTRATRPENGRTMHARMSEGARHEALPGCHCRRLQEMPGVH